MIRLDSPEFVGLAVLGLLFALRGWPHLPQRVWSILHRIFSLPHLRKQPAEIPQTPDIT